MIRTKPARTLIGSFCLMALMASGEGLTGSQSGTVPAPTSVGLPGPPTPPFQLRVREGSPLPPGCSAERAAGIVTDFIAAFNRGDQPGLTNLFPADAAGPAEAPRLGMFGWFAVTGAPDSFNPGFGAYSREELLPWLAERHARHERLQLLQLEVAGSWHGGVGMVFDVARQADDIPTHVAGGKGSLDCANRTIMVWNLGDREGLPDFVNPPPRPTCPATRPVCE